MSYVHWILGQVNPQLFRFGFHHWLTAKVWRSQWLSAGPIKCVVLATEQQPGGVKALCRSGSSSAASAWIMKLLEDAHAATYVVRTRTRTTYVCSTTYTTSWIPGYTNGITRGLWCQSHEKICNSNSNIMVAMSITSIMFSWTATPIQQYIDFATMNQILKVNILTNFVTSAYGESLNDSHTCDLQNMTSRSPYIKQNI